MTAPRYTAARLALWPQLRGPNDLCGPAVHAVADKLSLQKLQHEFRLRPLIGLTPDQAPGRVGKGPRSLYPPKRPSKAERRRIIGEAIGDLLLLISQKAAVAR
jgi:hypothetical protein